MKAAFRVDAGTFVGGGHLARCLTLAKQLRHEGVEDICFLMRAHEGAQFNAVTESGFELCVLPLQVDSDYSTYDGWVGAKKDQDAKDWVNVLEEKGFSSNDLIVVDHYGLDVEFENYFKRSGYKVCVVDDLVNRQHNCDVLIDQTCGRSASEYSDLVPSNAKLLVGSKYCLLREEFSENRLASLDRRVRLKNTNVVFLNFGSTDPGNVTQNILMSLEDYLADNRFRVLVVVGDAYPHISGLKKFLDGSRMSAELHVSPKSISELLVESDVAIGAAGSATWERFCLGIPSVLVKTADNQSDVISKVRELGAAVCIDQMGSFDAADLSESLEEVLANYEQIMAASCELVDGRGAGRLVSVLLEG
ncbi:UDP-2,4-diacetamido-2,4,6-trideoxy-beta-L-altropyranose hydrolase [bacterium SCSIO 12696]|nr:UDP-2,4-diacetamido-2,4,6-trideoxy-beta-L-altropyranose hydrolase [bacterium SCSIO 12696]